MPSIFAYWRHNSPVSFLTPDDGFAPVSRGAAIGWSAAFAAFLLYASLNRGEFLFIDNANLMFHEAGHMVFGWAGYYTQILGGTIAQVLVPLACVLFFKRRGDTAAVAATAWATNESYTTYSSPYYVEPRVALVEEPAVTTSSVPQ